MKYTKICPKCGSTNITLTTGGKVAIDYCKDCGYPRTSKDKSGFFPEVEIDKVEDFRKELKKHSNK